MTATQMLEALYQLDGCGMTITDYDELLCAIVAAGFEKDYRSRCGAHLLG